MSSALISQPRPARRTSARRGSSRALAALLVGLGLVAGSALPAQAAPSAPGSIEGYGFDACVAPDQSTMDAWNLYSPYSAVGIYISGNSRYCDDSYQPNLSKAWVAKNASRGWRFLPIHVGYQAPCFTNNPSSRVQKKKMSSSLNTARAQGRSDALESIAAMKKYGFARGSVSYLDIEWYPRTNTSCNNAVLRFIDGWTQQMHASGYQSGLYSSGSAAIKSVDLARTANWFDEPDQVWMAWTNKKADTDGGPYLSDAGWSQHQRVHQYHNDVSATHGGKRLTIDKNYLDVGRGTQASTDPKPCGVQMSFDDYPDLTVGSRGPEVAALECLLSQQTGQKVVNTHFGWDTRNNLNAFRQSQGWPPIGRTTPSTWTALLSADPNPRVLKRGSVGAHVWRLQRSLVAAGQDLTINGMFDAQTQRAVTSYRAAVGQPAYPTAESSLWAKLRRGAAAS